jgi:hypothetical protein
MPLGNDGRLCLTGRTPRGPALTVGLRLAPGRYRLDAVRVELRDR